MAADTKRGAVPEYVNYRDDEDPFWLHLPRLRTLLAAQGLHVVTAADKAVLDAMCGPDESEWSEYDAIGHRRAELLNAAIRSRRG